MARQRRGSRPIPAPPVPQTVEEIIARLREEQARRRPQGPRPRPAPPVPESLEDLIERIRREREAAQPREPAAPPSEYLWSYRCEWFSDVTGELLHSSFIQVLTNNPTNYQEAAAKARRFALMRLGQDTPLLDPAIHGATMRCHRVGDIIEFLGV